MSERLSAKQRDRQLLPRCSTRENRLPPGDGTLSAMSEMADIEMDHEPVGQATVVYLGPTAPHWDIRTVFGEREVMESFRHRVNARLMLLPPHDPQFRRNRERVNRDGERERILVEWDLGYPEDGPEGS